MDDFFRKHKDAFLDESITHIENMDSSLLSLEKSPQDSTLLHEIFRSTHTLKSMAATMNLNKMVELCHAIEDVLEAIRNQRISLGHCANSLFECFDCLGESIKAISLDKPESNTEALCTHIRSILNNDNTIKAKKYNEPDTETTFSVVEKLKTIGVKVERLDILMNLIEELLVSRIKLELLRESINNHELTATIDSLGRHITELQYIAMQVRLVPIGFLFNRFPRMVRDISRHLNKAVDIKIQGADIELDRSLIDEISESLVHIIRNALDHGIESGEVRAKCQKPPISVIQLSATRTKEFAIIEVSDDGQGLDTEKIREVAIRKKIILPDASEEEVLNSIFKGASTTKRVTSISGRGLGLSIVKQKIESIGGSIQVKSRKGEGTHFYIRIPLTLAVIKVLFVTVNGQNYAIPISNIERLLTVSADEIKGMLNYNAIIYQDQDIPVTHLAKLFFNKSTIMDRYSVVVMKQDESRYGIVVDSLLSTQEVVIKPLTRTVKENQFFTGTALIGAGEMVLILDVDQFFLSRREKNEWREPNTV